MTTAINLDFGLSPPSTCRTEVQPGTCKLGLNSIQKGSQRYTTPTGVTFRNNGMTVQDFNAGLRLPQMRTFLGPEYFNSGCTSLYCKDDTMCRGSKTARECQPTSDMMAYNFEAQCDSTGNSSPPWLAVGKGVTYNSTLGWELSDTSPGLLKWQEAGANSQCGQTFM